jgi:Mg2+ and Co2+ transporter CorA
MMPVILITILFIPMIFLMLICCAWVRAKRQMTLLSGG